MRTDRKTVHPTNLAPLIPVPPLSLGRVPGDPLLIPHPWTDGKSRI
jgi:hypothetical protein